MPQLGFVRLLHPDHETAMRNWNFSLVSSQPAAVSLG
jgi:hypothetical protein